MVKIKLKQKFGDDDGGDDFNDAKTDVNPYYNVLSTKVDNNLSEIEGSTKPSYDARQVSINQISKNDEYDDVITDNIKIDINPYYNVSSVAKMDDNLHELKKSGEPTYDNVEFNVDHASGVKMNVNPSYNINSAINDDLDYDDVIGIKMTKIHS